jgi:hypothetical protein
LPFFLVISKEFCHLTIFSEYPRKYMASAIVDISAVSLLLASLLFLVSLYYCSRPAVAGTLAAIAVHVVPVMSASASTLYLLLLTSLG